MTYVPFSFGLRFFITSITLIALTNFIACSSVVQRIDLAVFDILHDAVRPVTKHVVQVTITREEFNDPKLFDGRSPLNPRVLSRVVEKILEAQPAVLAVDIDTSNVSFMGLKLPASGRTPIVWARDVDSTHKPFQAQPYLGRSFWGPGAKSKLTQAGLTVFPTDHDHLVRMYSRCENAETMLPTFHFQIVRAFRARAEAAFPNEECVETETRPIRTHTPSVPPVTLRDLLGSDKPGSRNIIKDRIVLLGGTYGGDEHCGTTGLTSGLQLISDAVETELAGEVVEELPWWIATPIELLCAMLIAGLYRYRNAVAMLGACCIMILLLVTSALLLFNNLLWFHAPIPILGVWIEQQHESLSRHSVTAQHGNVVNNEI